MDENNKSEPKRSNLLPTSIFTSAVIIAMAIIYVWGPQNGIVQKEPKPIAMEEIVPSKGVTLSAKWGDLGARMVEAGVIDKTKFEALYAERGGLSEDGKKLTYETNNGNITITSENAGEVLNLLWALGLSNKNEILEQGPMSNPEYGGADRFASTGGWTLAKGDPMNHFSKHQFIMLTKEQQELVLKVAQNIYRPCCDNPTHFPDCNHGMAMLGLLELMASQGATEDELYKAAFTVNSYWFPDHYQMLATYMESKGLDWDEVNPKEMVGKSFASGSAAAQLKAAINPVEQSGGSSCGA